MKPKPPKQFPPLPNPSQKGVRSLTDVFREALQKTASEVKRMILLYQREFGEAALLSGEHYERFRALVLQMASAPAAVLGGVFAALLSFSSAHWRFAGRVGEEDVVVGVFCVRGEESIAVVRAQIDALGETPAQSDGANAEDVTDDAGK